MIPTPPAQRESPPHVASDMEWDSWHASARQEAENHWCLTTDCKHRAPAPGTRCPVCQDKPGPVIACKPTREGSA